MLNALHRLHVLRPFKSGRIWTAILAHAAFHLLNRFVLMLLHPFHQSTLDAPYMAYAVAQKSGAEHRYVGSDHQQLDHILVSMHAACRRKVGPDTPVKNSNPCQRKPQRLWSAEQNVWFDLQFFDVD